MKGKRHTSEQIIAKLREADALLASGATIGQVCQRLEVAEAAFHRWRNQYGGMKASDARATDWWAKLPITRPANEPAAHAAENDDS